MRSLPFSLAATLLFGLWLGVASSAPAATKSSTETRYGPDVTWNETKTKMKVDTPTDPGPIQIPCCKRDTP